MKIIVVIIYMFLIVSCDIRREIFLDDNVDVEVVVDWSAADHIPNGTSFIFFPREGDLYIVRTNNHYEKISIPVGVYDVICLNETIDSHDYISFEGIDHYDTALARWDELLSSRFNGVVESSDDALFVDRVEGVELSREDSVSRLMFCPQSLMSSVNVKVMVDGLNNIATSGSTLLLSGVSSAIHLSDGSLTGGYTSNLERFDTIVYDDDSKTSGYILSSFNIFGFVAIPGSEDHLNQITISIKLRDGTLYPEIVYNIDKLISNDNHINILLGSGADGDPTIRLPDVEDSEGDSNFNTDVDGWGDQENIGVEVTTIF